MKDNFPETNVSSNEMMFFCKSNASRGQSKTSTSKKDIYHKIKMVQKSQCVLDSSDQDKALMGFFEWLL